MNTYTSMYTKYKSTIKKISYSFTSMYTKYNYTYMSFIQICLGKDLFLCGKN